MKYIRTTHTHTHRTTSYPLTPNSLGLLLPLPSRLSVSPPSPETATRRSVLRPSPRGVIASASRLRCQMNDTEAANKRNSLWLHCLTFYFHVYCFQFRILLFFLGGGGIGKCFLDYTLVFFFLTELNLLLPLTMLSVAGARLRFWFGFGSEAFKTTPQIHTLCSTLNLNQM